MVKIYTQKWIERDDLRNNPNAVFLFGDNVRRKGMGGQAAAMRGEPNAIGIATKWAPDNRETSFFSDDDLERISPIITEDFLKAFDARSRGRLLIIPADGLGTGLSQLPERAPTINQLVVDFLDALVTGKTI